MSVTITIYDKQGGGYNKINKTPSGPKNYSGTFRDEFDSRRPKVTIIGPSNNFKNKPYCKIESRYYYIKNVVIRRNNENVLDLELDLLKTFASEINKVAVITTTTTKDNQYTVDDRVSFTERSEVYTATYSPVASSDSGSYILTTSGKPSNGYNFGLQTGSYSYSFPSNSSARMNSLRNIMDDLFSENILEGIANFAFGDPSDCLTGFGFLPMHYVTGGANRVTFGHTNLGSSFDLGFQFAPSKIVTHYSDLIPVPRRFNNFIDYKYSQYILFVPGIGNVELPPKLVVGKTVFIKYSTLPRTGETLVEVKNDSGATIFQSHTNIMIPIPISSKAYPSMGQVGLFGAGAGVATGLALSGTPAAPLVIGAGVLSQIGNSKPTPLPQSTTGSHNLLLKPNPELTMIYPEETVTGENHAPFGNPTSTSVNIGNLSAGFYCKPSAIDMSECGTAFDQEIESLLSSGFRT